MKSYARFFVAVFLASAVLFWWLYGRSLAWDVYSSDVYWYSEEYSIQGKIIVTSIFSLVVAGASVGLRILVVRLKKPGNGT